MQMTAAEQNEIYANAKTLLMVEILVPRPGYPCARPLDTTVSLYGMTKKARQQRQ